MAGTGGLVALGLFVAGLLLLVGGAESVVRGASRLAAAFGVSPLVIGLTVVAFGTSAPELAVTVRAGWAGAPDVAVGNVVGSNVMNVLFILGLSAVVAPVAVARQLVRLDVPLVVLASAALAGLAADGALGRGDGALLFGALLVYLWVTLRRARRGGSGCSGGEAEPRGRRPGTGGGRWRIVALDLARVAAGVALLVLGSRWLVEGAVSLASAMGVSPLVISLTIVSIGTSLPEVATSLAAAFRGERDMAVGNVVGSNLFNILGVLGLGALLAPRGIDVAPAAIHFDIPVMIAAAVACLPVFFTGWRIERWEGALFLAYYAAYMLYLLMDAAGHDGLDTYRNAMLWFVLPLTGVTLAVLAWRAWRRQGATPPAR